jgi:mannose-6-phosphate isomerase-like protein (cupin superfamily)
MSTFTVTNLKDAAASTSAPPGLEARLAREQLDSEHLGVSYFRYDPGVRTPFGHRHRVQEEAYVVIAGSGRAKLDDEIVELGQWDVLRVAPRTARALEAGPDGLELVVVGSDRSEDDGEGVEGFWEG